MALISLLREPTKHSWRIIQNLGALFFIPSWIVPAWHKKLSDNGTLFVRSVLSSQIQCEGIIFQWRGQSFLIILITCRYVAVNVRDLCLFAIMDLGRWERIIPHTTTPATHLNHLALSASRFQRVSHTHLPSRWDNWACQNWRSWTPHKKPDEKRETWFIKNRRVYVLNYKFWGIVWPSCYILTSGRLFLSLCLF